MGVGGPVTHQQCLLGPPSMQGALPATCFQSSGVRLVQAHTNGPCLTLSRHRAALVWGPPPGPRRPPETLAELPGVK